jgi:anti-sigma factor (TIGR02949 family)
MRCAQYRESLDARFDGELTPAEAQEIDAHLATCPECAREYETLTTTHRLLSENLMRHAAPDVLKARIRGALIDAGADAGVQPPARRVTPAWWRAVAAGVAIAAASSALTFEAVRRPASGPAEELLTSHIRSLQPGHLTDVVSTNQHNVKPWFNGRVDVSPAVPNLDTLGFPIVGGRTDYVRGRAVPVVVYARRQHMINVYVWPTSDESASTTQASTRNGYHFVSWRSVGLEYHAVSDLNATELDAFAKAFAAAR